MFEFSTIVLEDVLEAICRLSSSKSASLDGITAFMIKSCKDTISPILLYLYNQSFEQRKFPQLWKITKVRPLHKSGSLDDCNNYHPISIIPTVGKILERIVHGQCIKYLESYNILSKAQSGFRRGMSTGTCIAQFLDTVYREIDQGGACGVLFLDLAKAFDTVSHEVLLLKLRNVGFRQAAVNCFESYLSERSQVTIVDEVVSTRKQVSTHKLWSAPGFNPGASAVYLLH